MDKVVLVSGASSGLGQAVATYLYEQGCTVYAGARSYREPAVERKPDGSPGALHRAYLDVTDEESARRLIDDIVAREGRIDVLVNCAAIIILGSVEDLTMQEFHRVIDTNLYGVMRMCRSVLPHMRASERGLIINFSSGAGVIGLPFQSAYSASKFAIEGFSEVLRWEVKNLGIDVVVLEPGDSKSGSKNYRMRAASILSGQSAYIDNFNIVTSKFEADEANGAEPVLAARKVYRIISARRPKLRYNVFRLVENLLPLKMVMPNWFIEMVFFGYYNMKPMKKQVQKRAQGHGKQP